MYIFISHSSFNAKVALELCAALEKEGHQCFLAPRDIRPGHEYAEEIINGIDRSDSMIVLLSDKSNHSPHVLREVERAVSKSIPIIIYKLEEVVLTKSMEYFLMAHQWMNSENDIGYQGIIEAVGSFGSTQGKQGVKKQKGKKKLFFGLVGSLTIFGILMIMVFRLYMAQPMDIPDIKVGDTIVFGEYNQEEIQWRVLKVEENGTEAVLVSENILTMKAFDAAESGKYNYDKGINYWAKAADAEADLELQVRLKGNSDWGQSNIRQWLNSDKEVVQYKGQGPSVTAMSELKNGYNTEPGFLYGFTEEEKSAIKEVQIETKGNALSDGTNITMDKVYLLSKEELTWFSEAGINLLAIPTAKAVEQDKTKWYQSYSLDLGVEAYFWWLREPEEGSVSKCYLVNNGYAEETLFTNTAGVEGFGIRPAITVDLRADCIAEGKK